MKDLELKLLQAFKDLQDVLPSLTKVSFEVNKYPHDSEPFVSGFYHYDGNCFQYNTIDKLIRILMLFKKTQEVSK